VQALWRLLYQKYAVHWMCYCCDRTSIFLFLLLLLMGWDWVHLVLRPLTGLLYQPQMIDGGDCGAVGGMKIGRGNRSTRRKLGPVPLCPPQIPHDLTRAWTRADAVGSQRLTAWAMARSDRRIVARWLSPLRSEFREIWHRCIRIK
jgi:hypothetical protein